MGRTHLIQRNGCLYFQMRVPHPLWEHLPKEIKFSFKRSGYGKYPEEVYITLCALFNRTNRTYEESIGEG